ncbi:hypothetical protein NFI96_026887 [Prochilodus magdalenae]|nr:hypothetical protein NFI96_026887 [Prochilodus magdalenae]
MLVFGVAADSHVSYFHIMFFPHDAIYFVECEPVPPACQKPPHKLQILTLVMLQVHSYLVNGVGRAEPPANSCVYMNPNNSIPPPSYFSNGRPSTDLRLQTFGAGPPGHGYVYMNSTNSAYPPLYSSTEKTSDLSLWFFPLYHTFRLQTYRAEPPEPSRVSMRSSNSMYEPPKFNNDRSSTELRLQTYRAEPPEPSRVSMRSSNSMYEPPKFNNDRSSTELRLQTFRAEPPEPSCVSMWSNNSMYEPPKFNNDGSSTDLSSESVEPDLKITSTVFNDLVCVTSILELRELDAQTHMMSVKMCTSGICTEIFREESVTSPEEVTALYNLSFSDRFLAALYVFHCYVSKNMEELQCLKTRNTKWSDSVSLEELLREAICKVLESENGHLDQFLRFLLGISLESNQQLLKYLLTQTVRSSESMKKTVQYIKRIIPTKNLSSEKSINLLLCLTEMNDQSLSRNIQTYLKSDRSSKKKLSPGECLALAYMLVTSEEVLDELNLKSFRTSVRGYLRLIPAVSNCRKAVLADCKLTMKSFETICAALKSTNSPLKELDLSNTDPQDSGVKLLSAGLKSSNCKLEILSCHSVELQSVIRDRTVSLEELHHELNSSSALIGVMNEAVIFLPVISGRDSSGPVK